MSGGQDWAQQYIVSGTVPDAGVPEPRTKPRSNFDPHKAAEYGDMVAPVGEVVYAKPCPRDCGFVGRSEDEFYEHLARCEASPTHVEPRRRGCLDGGCCGE